MSDKKSAPATKDDLKGLATKADLAAVDTKLSIAVAKTQADIREIKETIATKLATRDDISRLMNHIDAFAAEALSHRNHDKLRGGKIMEHETKLSDHENRLTTLETK